MNPLSPVTYYRRHVKSALLFLAFIGLMTLGVAVMVRLVDSIWEELYNAQRYMTRLSLVSAADPTLDPGIVAQIRAHPGVAQVIQAKSLDMGLPQLVNSFHLLGVSEADTQALMDICSLHLREGRLPRARTNEMLLSEEIALANEKRFVILLHVPGNERLAAPEVQAGVEWLSKECTEELLNNTGLKSL